VRINVDSYLAIIGTALTAVSIFWPVNIVMGRGFLGVWKIILGALGWGKRLEKTTLLRCDGVELCRKTNRNVDKCVTLHIPVDNAFFFGRGLLNDVRRHSV
jgi:hypothetical protein